MRGTKTVNSEKKRKMEHADDTMGHLSYVGEEREGAEPGPAPF